MKQGKGGKAAAVGAGVGVEGEGALGGEEELLTLDPAELELPPGIKTDSECCGDCNDCGCGGGAWSISGCSPSSN